VAAIGCHRGEQEHYGFIARLGNDTISVENIIRRGDKVIVDGVDRFPRVRRRHTEIELGPGQFFGELALISEDATRTARVQAKTELRCLALDRASFRTLVAEHPEVAASLLEVALGRLAENAGVGDS